MLAHQIKTPSPEEVGDNSFDKINTFLKEKANIEIPEDFRGLYEDTALSNSGMIHCLDAYSSDILKKVFEDERDKIISGELIVLPVLYNGEVRGINILKRKKIETTSLVSESDINSGKVVSILNPNS